MGTGCDGSVSAAARSRRQPPAYVPRLGLPFVAPLTASSRAATSLAVQPRSSTSAPALASSSPSSCAKAGGENAAGASRSASLRRRCEGESEGDSTSGLRRGRRLRRTAEAAGDAGDDAVAEAAADGVFCSTLHFFAGCGELSLAARLVEAFAVAADDKSALAGAFLALCRVSCGAATVRSLLSLAALTAFFDARLRGDDVAVFAWRLSVPTEVDCVRCVVGLGTRHRCVTLKEVASRSRERQGG